MPTSAPVTTLVSNGGVALSHAQMDANSSGTGIWTTGLTLVVS